MSTYCPIGPGEVSRGPPAIGPQLGLRTADDGELGGVHDAVVRSGTAVDGVVAAHAVARVERVGAGQAEERIRATASDEEVRHAGADQAIVRTRADETLGSDQYVGAQAGRETGGEARADGGRAG